MKTYFNPPAQNWASILARPAKDVSQLNETVSQILREVQQRGDDALLDFTAKFDGVRLADLKVAPEEIEWAPTLLSDDLKAAIQVAYQNIERFHASQKEPVEVIETMPGINCWRKNIGIEKVGLYIPGGTAPLFSTVLMLAIPANLAGCKEVILCTPPNADGAVHPAILYAAQLAGVSQIFKVGGAQAIAAMAYGTETIPAAYKIFGPGNAFVTVAKQLVGQSTVAIDMPAGPSEVMVLADDSAEPAFVAADLLSQAEHGADSQVVLVTYNASLAEKIEAEVVAQLHDLPRREIAEQCMAQSSIVVVKDEATAIAIINDYAPEHLIVATARAEDIAEQVINAGSVFLGHYTPESLGDYASGTNHTLPTYGYAKAYSGVSLDSFVRKITFQQASTEGIQNIGSAVMKMAKAEGLEAHSRAVAFRLDRLSKLNNDE